MLAMLEVLSNTIDLTTPLRDQQFYLLRLFEEGNPLGTRFCVGQTHSAWSEVDQQVTSEAEEVDHFWILDEAKQRYAERKLLLAAKGFIYSDMDLL